MSDPPNEQPGIGSGRGALLAIGGAAVATPLALAAIGAADLPAAICASAGLAVLTIALGARALRLRREAPPAVTPATRGDGTRNDRFAEAFDVLADPALLIEGIGQEDASARRFVFANAAARELLRIQRREGPLTTALRSPEVLQAVEEALIGGIVGDAVYESGGVQNRFWRVRVAPLHPLEPGRGLALLTLRDETEIRRSERTRADFLANASHELRTPLASLAGFIETLRGHARDDAEARDKFLAIMHDQSERMRRLIDDLMSLSRIELGEHIPPSGLIDVGPAVMDVLDALSPLASERGVTLSPNLPAPGEASVVGDRDQIVQVVQNLVENALKYTAHEGVVGVEVLTRYDHLALAGPRVSRTAQFSLLTPEHSIARRYVAVRVTDAGPGIAREHLPRLTERFYRVEGQKSSERTGTGLGLAIVKHIMNRHRGGLVVESSEGAGSIFTALFPCPDVATTEVASPPSSESGQYSVDNPRRPGA
jgi:two-component system phosphate regulon sensor histidine kinase PhoR